MATGWCGTETHPPTEHEQRPSCIFFIPNTTTMQGAPA